MSVHGTGIQIDYNKQPRREPSESSEKEKAEGRASVVSKAPTPTPAPGRGRKGPRANVTVEGVIVEDAVFGEVNDGGPNYRGLGWIRTAVLSSKVQIGLGVLGMPQVLSTLGLVPGIILIAAFGALTTWCNYIVGCFKLAHPEVYSFADVGFIIAGRFGREFLGVFYWLQLTAVAGAGMLGIATAFNQMTDNAGCTAAWAFVGAVLTFGFSVIRTLDKISWIGWIGLAGIMSSVITLTIAVGVQDRPAEAPQIGPWDPQVVYFGSPTFLDAMTAVSTILFSFGAAPNFINILAEMRRPQDFKKALWASQLFVTATYLIIGCVVYHFCGIFVASPALGSAGVLLKKVCYGIALPGLIVGCVLNTHSPAKYIFLRLMRGSQHLNSNGWQHWTVWSTCVFVNTIIAYIIAEAIPFFGSLVGLIGALIVTVLCLLAPGVMWLYEHHERLRVERSGALVLGAVFNVWIILAGALICAAGTVGSVIDINKSLHDGSASAPFSC